MVFLWIILGIAVALYTLFQIFGIVFGLFSKYNDWGKVLKEDENGMFSLNVAESRAEWVFTTLGILILSLRKKGYVANMAEKDADKGKYNNKFKKDSLKKVYDKTYLLKRKEIIEKTVVQDLFHGEKTYSFLNDAEKALYQNTYLQKKTGKENAKRIMEQRAEELYAEIEFEPVDDYVFDKITEK